MPTKFSVWLPGTMTAPSLIASSQMLRSVISDRCGFSTNPFVLEPVRKMSEGRTEYAQAHSGHSSDEQELRTVESAKRVTIHRSEIATIKRHRTAKEEASACKLRHASHFASLPSTGWPHDFWFMRAYARSARLQGSKTTLAHAVPRSIRRNIRVSSNLADMRMQKWC